MKLPYQGLETYRFQKRPYTVDLIDFNGFYIHILQLVSNINIDVFTTFPLVSTGYGSDVTRRGVLIAAISREILNWCPPHHAAHALARGTHSGSVMLALYRKWKFLNSNTPQFRRKFLISMATHRTETYSILFTHTRTPSSC